MARSTFYYHRGKRETEKYSTCKQTIKVIYHKHKGRYGHRRIAIELRKRGYNISGKTVLKLMNVCGLKCNVRLKKYRSYKGEFGEAAPNILWRNFKADEPNQKWVTDVTQFELMGCKCYLSPILDLYNGKIIQTNF